MLPVLGQMASLKRAFRAEITAGPAAEPPAGGQGATVPAAVCGSVVPFTTEGFQMKRTLAVAAALAALTLPAAAQTRAARAARTHGAEEVNEAATRAFKANDPNAMAALYAPDAVMYAPTVMEVRGPSGVRQWFEDLTARFRITDAAMTDAHYETAGDVSVGWGRFVVTAVPRAGGAAVRWEGRRTWVARRIRGRWLMVSNHASMPLPSAPAAPGGVSAPAR